MPKNRVDETYDVLIQWLESHNGEMPRSTFKAEGKILTTAEMTASEKEEKNLYLRWIRTKENKALRACEGIPLDELPDEYAEYKEKIARLREFGLGKTPYEEVLEWIRSHNGKMPQRAFFVDGKALKSHEMTEEQRYEKNIYQKWIRTPEYEALKACIGIPIDKIPKEYEKYKNAIEEMRKYDPSKKEIRSIYDELIKWLDTHEGEMPQSAFYIDNKRLSASELTDEQRYQVNLYANWRHTPEFKALRECKDTPLDKLPPEYEQYREEIATLRKYEEQRKAKKAEELMRKSVGKRVQDNAETRQELENLIKEKEEKQMDEIWEVWYNITILERGEEYVK